MTTVKYAVNEHVHSGRILQSTCRPHAGGDVGQSNVVWRMQHVNRNIRLVWR